MKSIKRIVCIWSVVLAAAVLAVLLILFCIERQDIVRKLDVAESVMEERPDSALAILRGINLPQYVLPFDEARHALLTTIALDKNYIDTTTFDILQPALDWYADHGTPDQRFRTYYYQGVIYSNGNDLENALASYVRAHNIAGITDSITLARSLVARAMVDHDLYDFVNMTEEYVRAAEIFKNLNNTEWEFHSWQRALNGCVLSRNEERADSIIAVCRNINGVSEEKKRDFDYSVLTKVRVFDTTEELRNYLTEYCDDSIEDFENSLELVAAYTRLEDYDKAFSILARIDTTGRVNQKYRAITVTLFDRAGQHDSALKNYKDFSAVEDSISYARMSINTNRVLDQQDREVKWRGIIRSNKRIIWLSAVGIVALIAIIAVIFRKIRIVGKAKKDVEEHAERVKADNERLESKNKDLQAAHENMATEISNLSKTVENLKEELSRLKRISESNINITEEVRSVINARMDLLNPVLAAALTSNEKYTKKFQEQFAMLSANANDFMRATRLSFTALYPDFIKHLEERGLAEKEIEYVCMYGLGLTGREIGEYMNRASHVNMSSGIRKKLGLDSHSTNLSNYVKNYLNNCNIR
ncbi:MAG: hypothetical protein K2I48_01385 [Muribaculaceae bacterium]|nr:hypothetical protein [Muribaculaceae bacterium]